MKKLLLLLLLHAWATASFAQFSASDPAVDEALAPPTRWQQHADSIFQHIDRSQVATGLLVNYGFALKDYHPFQGTALTAANKVHTPLDWRLLYMALQTSTFNGNATLPSLLLANQRIEQAQQNTAVVSLATLLARYDEFRADAGTSGLFTRSGQQLYDAPTRPRSPYEQHTLVALCPLQTVLDTRTPQFKLPTLLRFTNAAPAITALALDADDGQGYRAVGWDQPIGASYAANGSYTLRLKLTCADGTVLLSQAHLEVQQPDASAARYGNNGVITRHSSTLFSDTRAYNGGVAGGTVTVAYATGNNTGTIRKPLIVLEGYDVSHALNSPRYNYDYRYFTTQSDFGAIFTQYNATNPNDRGIFNDQLSDVGQYDLIFLDYDNGTDYIQRNAYLAERLIQWVNDNKQPLNGVRQQNVVMGMSMGGLVARYALRDMEVRRANNPSLPAHETRLYISHEAPHQGANVPLGFQYMVKSVADIRIYGLIKLGTINPELGRFAKLLDEPATQQLLIYQTDPRGGNLHNSWLSEYNQLGYPTQCRNVATSGGSECGQPQVFGPYAQLLKIQGSGLLDSQYSGLANGSNFLLGA